jgi:uncharacterized protein YndB with AHSA1/START domain
MSKMNLIAEPGQHALEMSREFDAPRELVFKAFTDPKLISQWWGQRESTTIVDQMDVKMGGVWRFIQREANGQEYAFRGVFHEVRPSERLVYTFEFEPMAGHILLETITFEQHGDKTRVIDSAVFQSVADRDGMIQSGMEGGAAESWDRMEELLQRL